MKYKRSCLFKLGLFSLTIVLLSSSSCSNWKKPARIVKIHGLKIIAEDPIINLEDNFFVFKFIFQNDNQIHWIHDINAHFCWRFSTYQGWSDGYANLPQRKCGSLISRLEKEGYKRFRFPTSGGRFGNLLRPGEKCKVYTTFTIERWKHGHSFKNRETIKLIKVYTFSISGYRGFFIAFLLKPDGEIKEVGEYNLEWIYEKDVDTNKWYVKNSKVLK